MIHKFREVLNAFSEIVKNDGKRVTVHEQIIEISSINNQTEGEFIVDSSISEDTRLEIFVEDEEDHLIKSVIFTDSRGTTYGPYRRMTTTHDHVNMKTINYGLDDSPMIQPGRWRYKVEWYTMPGVVREAAIVISGKEHDNAGYRVDMWTSAGGGKDIVTYQHPLVVYVSVYRGDMPVLGARVRVDITITGTDHNNTIELYDNGNGDPDITANDGVYSRYITEYPAPGRYTFTVTVDDNDNQAVVATEDDYPKNNNCCGSDTNANINTAKKTGMFTRKINGGAIILEQVPDSLSSDRMPPSKVGDFQVEVIPEAHMLRASWTAPGDDFDSGYVAGYRIVYARNISDLLDHQKQKQVLTELESNEELAGVKKSFQFSFDHFDDEYYVGLVAYDAANNSGKISNVVNIIMPAKIHHGSQGHVVKDNSEEVSEEKGEDEWMMILALCCSFLLLCLALLCGVIYFLKCAKPRKVITMDVCVDDESTCSDPRNTSSHRLVVDIATITGTSPPFTAPPDSLPESTPSYWSASQLLTEHEHRALTATYAAPSLTPIKEEYLQYFDEIPQHSDYYEIDNPGYSAPLQSPSSSVVSAVEEDSPATPVRFSTAVQTIAPSAIATLRQSKDFIASRNTSLV